MRSSRLFAVLLLPILLFGFATQAAAQFTTLDWSNATTDVSNSSFNTGTLLFSPIVSSSLLSINNPSSGYGHGTGTYELEVLSGGNWISIYSVNVSGAGNVLISTIPTPISFPAMVIDGVRLRGAPPDNQSFHSVDALMTFTFTAGAIAVPSLSIPGKLAMLLILLTTGVYAGRRWLV